MNTKDLNEAPYHIVGSLATPSGAPGKEEPCWMLECGHLSPCVSRQRAEIRAVLLSEVLRFGPDAKSEAWHVRPLISYLLMHTDPTIPFQHTLLFLPSSLHSF